MRLLISGQGAFPTEARDEELSVLGRRVGHTLNRFRPCGFLVGCQNRAVTEAVLRARYRWLLT